MNPADLKPPAPADAIRAVLVEDNMLDVEMVLRHIRGDGLLIASRVAFDEPSFRQALADFAPQLILSDFSLPEFDGLEALRIAREVAPDVPFIFVSGTIGEERAINALRNGASDYILKDNLRRLVPAIQGALRSSKSERDRRMQEERIARLNRAISFLSGINSAIVRIRDRRELLHEACRLAVQVGEYSMATVYLRQATESEPMIHRAVAARHAGSKRPDREPISGNGPVGRVMSQGQRVIVYDITDAGTHIPQRGRLVEMGVRACIALPLTVDGTPVGALLLHSDDPRAFSDAELGLLDQVIGNLTFALQYLRSKENVEYLEYFDTLTALANRTLYVQRLNDAIRAAERDGDHVSLLVCDIVGLNVVNDGLGHHAGDLVLQLAAERLKNVFHDSASLSHLGGGAFAAFARHPATGTDAPTVLRERMQIVFDAPFRIGEQEFRLSARAGFAAFPEDGADANALLQHAQTALGHAKRSGEIFSRHRPDMTAAASERLTLITRLRDAAAQKSFVLNYQPRIRLADGAVEGVEALIRWPGSNVSPAVFVPLLESLGLIGDVGGWVLSKALAEGATWRPDAKPGEFRIAVNISALQLRRKQFAEEVLGAAAAFRNGRARLELEITESVLMDDTRRACAILERLREAGITVAIDDFGTGHASLQILSQLPVDTLKIDRSFLHDIASNERHRLLVQLTIMLAKSFGLATVAEGVEHEQQAALLRELGCDSMQGYLVLRPAGAHELGEWLALHSSTD